MILIFDLDDTLYPEITYVYSGFKQVAKFISSVAHCAEDKVYEDLLCTLNRMGRGIVFNVVLKELGVYNQSNLKKCVSVYRKHQPSIRLPVNTKKVLHFFKDYRKYLVTDGNLVAQRSKIKALGVSKYFVKTMPTHQYGAQFAKPSTYCFELIKSWEGCEFLDMVYIGDNPNKDFVNLKPLGIQTIRINQGMFKDQFFDQRQEAEIILMNLEELMDLIPTFRYYEQ